MGGTRSPSRSAGHQGRSLGSRSRRHGRRSHGSREDEDLCGRRLQSKERRPQEEQWQRPGRHSWSPRPPRSSASGAASPGPSQSPGVAAGAAAPSQQQSQPERLRLREERKQQKDLLKALEMPQDKRARRVTKKEAKERKKGQKMGWGEEYTGYTDTDNPFGDNNLLGTFIWNKALEKKGISLLENELKQRSKRVQEDNQRELHKVKQLRLEREREKALREQELELRQREAEAEHFKTWEEQENHFHLQQAKLRADIRIQDGRAKPIDLLIKYVSVEEHDPALDIQEPYTFLNGLTVADLEDLLEDMQVYAELEQGKNAAFWRDMTILTKDEISKLQTLDVSGRGPGELREGVNASVSSDVESVFKGKTYRHLQVIFQGIEGKIHAGGPNLDVGYWESLLQRLHAHMARARLRERHQDRLQQKLYKLKQEQGVGCGPLPPTLKREPLPEGEMDGHSEAVLKEEDRLQQSLDSYLEGRYSPQLLTAQELPLDAHVLEPEEDWQRLQLSRQQLQVTGDASQSAEDSFRPTKDGTGQEEAQCSEGPPLSSEAYLWADKYRPRKPRFFNRVHTGFEWNKYNRTHYDVDNPPPKMVQGYKFNIFYPDLMDKRSTPQYFLEACADNKDFAILRFHAGPPYEDIAFKIVNREWDYSHRHGFRCRFTNGILQLWFHFKRYHYRR